MSTKGLVRAAARGQRRLPDWDAGTPAPRREAPGQGDRSPGGQDASGWGLSCVLEGDILGCKSRL